MLIIKKFCSFVFMLIAMYHSSIFAQSEYVGSQVCSGCHAEQFNLWRGSHHDKAMNHADAANVLGDFNDITFEHQSVKSTFTKDEDHFYIEVQEDQGKKEKYPIVFTFGYFPLQQYLVDIGDGKLQAYDVAWDSRSKEDGGQRWFKLQPNANTRSDSELHWKRHINNWNSRCAECHSTNIQKQFNPDTLSYTTTFDEINVACEACHGPGEKHVQLVHKKEYAAGNNSGFEHQLERHKAFSFKDESPIAKAPRLDEAKSVQQSQVDTCGGCHSRRQIINELEPGNDYHDQYQITLLHEPLYYVDGQIHDEDFVLGSFLQSKMYQQGVTCTHCHDAHSGKLRIEGDALCSQCHNPTVFASRDHHKHVPQSEGSHCVNCHMPTTTYMEIDDRRDHSFLIPGAASSEDLPNPCRVCHDESVKPWTNKQDDFATLNAAAQAANPLALREIAEYIESAAYPSIKRASLLANIGNVPSRLSAETITLQSRSSDPMLRRSALQAAQFFPIEMRWKTFNALLDDPVNSVQAVAVDLLAPALPSLESADAKRLNEKIEHHRQRLQYSAGSPAGQSAIASFELALGNRDNAINAYETALQIDQHYLPGILNLAEIYRNNGDTQLEKSYLDKAMKVAPDIAATQHALGLYAIRQNNIHGALDYLKQATLLEPSQQRYFYVYAVALDSVGKTNDAIDVLKRSDAQWPNQFDTLMTLMHYLEKSDLKSDSYAYLSRLSAIAPNHPEIQQRISELKKDNQ